MRGRAGGGLVEHSNEDRAHPNRTLAILCFAALAYSLAQTTLVPALPQLMRGLHTDQSGVTWTLTSYLVSAAVFTPLIGRVGDIYGKRRLLVLSLGAFGVGSVLAALSSHLWVVVAGRVVMGIGGGIFPLCFAIIRDEFPRERVGGAVGLMSALTGIGGGSGLIIGGLIADHASYHWIFWLGAAMAALAGVAAQVLVPESPIRTPARLDIRGAVVLAVGLTMPLIAISQASRAGWGSARTIGMLTAGVVVLACWVQLERRTPQPLASISSLLEPRVLMTNVATLLVGFGMFGSFVLVPMLAQAPLSTGYGFGDDATHAGFLLLPGSLGMLVLGPLSGRLGSRFGNKLPLALGAFVTSIGLAMLAIQHGTPHEVLAYCVVMSSGIGLSFAAMPNLILESVSPHQTGEATGFNALIRSVGSSLGSQISATLLAATAVNGLAQDSGFTHAFATSSVIAAVAGVVSLAIPGSPSRTHAPALQEVGAASPLAEPGLPG